MTVDLVINGGTLVFPDGTLQASLAIQGEQIAAIGLPETMPPAKEVLDATGLYILPGAIDAHVHFREPGYTHKEDWQTGSAAAAMGGVTTVFEMPNVNPPTGTPEALAQKHALAAEKSHVDFGLYGLLAEDNIDQLEALVAGGVAGFKCFMGNTFGNLPSPSTGAMLEGFEIVARHGLRIALHAETASIMARRTAALQAAGRTDPLAHLDARPAVVAIEAVSRAAVLAEWTGARIHVLHVSSADELRPLREAKARGVDITAETCPQYLLLDSGEYGRLKGVIRVNPPVREARHKDPLWAALADGTIDMIATDHAPHVPEEKGRASIWDCDCGFPGVETQMPLMLTEVARGRMAITDYVRWSAANPARSFGLYPRKGVLRPGSDADLAIVDLRREATIKDAVLQSRAKITPWNGRLVQGLPMHTLVRGRFVMRDRALVEQAKGWGRSVHAIQRMPAPKPQHVENTTAAITAPVARAAE